MKNEKTYELVLTALFTAIIIIMAFTPLGYIPLVVINATIIHIPVILGALFLRHTVLCVYSRSEAVKRRTESMGDCDQPCGFRSFVCFPDHILKTYVTG